MHLNGIVGFVHVGVIELFHILAEASADVNLLIMYWQVKFMKSVPGTALVEMGDEYAVDRAITHLNSIKVFGKRLNVW